MRRLFERCRPTAHGAAASTGSVRGVQDHGRSLGSGAHRRWTTPIPATPSPPLSLPLLLCTGHLSVQTRWRPTTTSRCTASAGMSWCADGSVTVQLLGERSLFLFNFFYAIRVILLAVILEHLACRDSFMLSFPSSPASPSSRYSPPPPSSSSVTASGSSSPRSKPS
jgi:hypothetical protein